MSVPESGGAEAAELAVRRLYDAFHGRRRVDTEGLLTDDFRFTSPYDDGIDKAAYFERCWPNGDRFVEFSIERVAADAEGAYVTYWCSTKEGDGFRNTEYLKVRNGRVASVDVYFGESYHDGKFVPQPQTEREGDARSNDREATPQGATVPGAPETAP